MLSSTCSSAGQAGRLASDDRRSKLVIIARDLERDQVERILNSYLALGWRELGMRLSR